jgi:phosphoglucomutase
MTAVTGRDPGELYRELTRELGEPQFERIDAPATREQKKLLSQLAPQNVKATQLAGEKILSMITETPGTKEPIGGLKVVTENSWFAARPSGTEDVYKIYAETFKGEDHLQQILEEAQALIGGVFKAAGMA